MNKLSLTNYIDSSLKLAEVLSYLETYLKEVREHSLPTQLKKLQETTLGVSDRTHNNDSILSTAKSLKSNYDLEILQIDKLVLDHDLEKLVGTAILDFQEQLALIKANDVEVPYSEYSIDQENRLNDLSSDLAKTLSPSQYQDLIEIFEQVKLYFDVFNEDEKFSALNEILDIIESAFEYQKRLGLSKESLEKLFELKKFSEFFVQQKLRNVTNRLSNEIIALKNQLSNKTSDNKISASLKKINLEGKEAVSELERRLNESRESLDTAHETFESNTNEILKNLSEQIRSLRQESLDDLTHKKADLSKDFQKDVDNEIGSIQSRINNEITQFEAKRKYMDQLLEKVGLANDANVTLSQADKEETMANELRQKGVFLLYASVVLLVILFSGFVGIDLIADSGKTISDLTKDIAISRGLLPGLLLILGVALFALNKEAAENQDRKLTAHTVGFYLMMISLPLFVLQFIEFTGIALFTDIKATNKPEPEDFVFRFMTVLLVSSPALYMLKESASHRAKENLYRQRGTQLVSISGYLSDLPPEPKAEVKQRLADNFFSFHDKKTDTSNVPDFLKNMNDAVKLAKQVNAGQNPQPQEPSPQKNQG
ncbi:hypothetical protein LMH77_11015 [Vibrio lentus]|uniref:hypothetical protein n=1 Tax=Vibrio lentus TaxID=136468 RepID=UPI000C85CF7C|nr:hypothetical protein [Vibrio lentus]MCC4783432.1 hypothetical protein [Vibrio lentus]PMJ08968.1 hypothetical protein BCU31_17350 [Vibrio lentus]TKG18580.1 hypothetical protein FCW05_11070 [Vibrio lentus]